MQVFAIIEVASRQFKVSPGDIICIPRRAHEKEVSLDRVLLVSSGKDINVGNPYLKGAKVICDVIGDVRGEKKISYKFKRRTGYHRKTGHREDLTKVKVKEIVALAEKK